ncbi:hypothetical protein D3C76_1260740 [compost metagenome]
MDSAQCRAEDEGFAALLVDVGEPEVGPGFRQTRGTPFEEVLGGERQLRGGLQLQGQLVARQVQLLGLDPWQGQGLALVQRCLAVGDTVDGAGAQQGLAPVHRVPAQARLEGHVAKVVFAKDESVHPFTGWPLVIAIGVATQAQRRRTGG